MSFTNQAIVRHTSTTSLTFTSKPSEETRKGLIASGFQFNGKSGQWYRGHETAELMTEEQVTQDAGSTGQLAA